MEPVETEPLQRALERCISICVSLNAVFDNVLRTRPHLQRCPAWDIDRVESPSSIDAMRISIVKSLTVLYDSVAVVRERRMLWLRSLGQSSSKHTKSWYFLCYQAEPFHSLDSN